MTAILWKTFSNGIFLMKEYVFQMKFHWRLSQGDNIPALLQIMDWRRPGPSHYLNQCCNIVVSTLSNIFVWTLCSKSIDISGITEKIFKRQPHCVHLQMLRCMCRNRRYFEKLEKKHNSINVSHCWYRCGHVAVCFVLPSYEVGFYSSLSFTMVICTRILTSREVRYSVTNIVA